jgi:predicted short-subunit dehydrogenase-like oxidoreductase (DUF2520 family)
LPALRIIGPGRAGLSLQRALAEAGWTALPPLGRHDDLTAAAEGVDLLVIAVPDAAISGVASLVRPIDTTVVAHLAGSLGLEELAPHARRASIHPLVALPNPEVGAARLRGTWFATEGDRLVDGVVRDLEGRAVIVAAGRRAAYHAAACIASNHLVALLAQVELVAATAGVPLDAYLDLVRATVDSVERLGPAAALTGPAARGDWATIQRHRDALPEGERAAYDALMERAAELAGTGGMEPVPCR